jgi:hypothetical protein
MFQPRKEKRKGEREGRRDGRRNTQAKRKNIWREYDSNEASL